MDRGDRGFPRFEPVLIVDGADRELANRSEAEGLQMAERVARVGDFRERVDVLDEIRLDEVIGAAARRDRKLDRDPVVAVATQDLAHRFDRLRMGGNGDLEPARSCRASRHPSRL